MQRVLLLIVSAVLAAAQAVPGRYIVEFQTEPAAAVVAARKARFSMADGAVQARRAEILAEQVLAEGGIRDLGGAVTHRYTTVLNGMSVQIPDSAVARLRTLPGVRGVYPVKAWHPVLEHAVRVHRAVDAWASLAGGQASAGAGVKIGILDGGVDAAHPGFQSFSTPVPAGFPIACAYAVDSQGNLGKCLASPAEVANTNSKVIVSRDYTGEGGVDVDGHGTGVAMIAAGLTTKATVDVLLSDGATILPIPLASITGVAPGAWLGNYKVCSDTSGCLTNWFLQALEDALADGMNVVNYSVGGPVLDSTSESGPESRAISNAMSAGLAVVIAAGNDGFNANGGQSPSTIDEPAVSGDAITVGAIGNERVFTYAVIMGSLAPMKVAFPDITSDINTPNLTDPVTGPLVDVAAIDGNGFGCTALTAASLKGQVALIQRSTRGAADACAFDVKLNNAMNAGAIAAVVYDSVPNELIRMTLSTTTLPALFVTQSDGVTLKQQVAANPGANVYMDFAGFTPFPISADIVAAYSPAGPTPTGNIKPEVVAVGGYDAGTGDEVLTAASTSNAPDPFQIAAGTSFSAPFVTGAVAVVMGARPGLTAQQYKSLIVNSAPQVNICFDGSAPNAGKCGDGSSPVPASIQVAGMGRLDVLGAIQNSLTVAPTVINFQTGSGSVNKTQSIVVTNAGTASDTFTVTVSPVDGALVPTVDAASFSLDPGASRTINVSLAATALTAGTFHDGFVTINSAKGSTATRVSYWFGVPGASVQNISLLNQNQLNGGAPARSQVPIYIRYTDAIGLPLDAGAPTVTIPGTRARVVSISAVGDVPGTYRILVQLDTGLALGYDEFDIAVPNGPVLQVFVPIG